MSNLSIADKVLVVTTALDVVDANDGVLSLREALDLAAEYAASGSVAITFDQSLKGQKIVIDDTLTLAENTFNSANNQLLIDGDIDQDGRADVTIDGQKQYRVLNVSDYNHVKINGLKIINGNHPNGGGLNNGEQSVALISNCEFYGNSAGDGGGAIVNICELTVVNSLFSGNHANYGGAVFNYLDGETTVISSTLTGNTSGYSDCGGAIMNGWWCFSNDNRISILNSIVAGNTSNGSSCDVKNYSGKIAEMSYSLVGVVSGFTADTTNSTGYTSTENILNDDLTLINNNNPAVTGGVKCGFTADGLAVYTLDNINWQYLNGSVYSGSVTEITTDCAGNQRNDDYSIGAFEYDDGSNAPVNDKLIVTTTEDVVDANDGVISLREAVAYAATLPGVQTVTFAVNGTIELSSSLDIVNYICIDGVGYDVTLSGADTAPVFAFTGPEMTLKNLTITSNYTGSDAAIAGIKTNQYIYLSNVKDSSSAALNWSVEMRNSELHVSDASNISKVAINANTATWGTGGVKSLSGSTITGLSVNGQQLRDGGDVEIYGYLQSWSILSAVDTNTWQLAGVSDFNNDGTDDIAWCNTNTTATGYWQINNKTLSTWQNIATVY